MAIPDYQTIMLPLLRYLGDDREHSLREAIEQLAIEFQLTANERKELLPSGKQPTFDNRVGWARTYMKKAGLLESKRRGFFAITERGKNVLTQNPTKIDVRFLKRYPEFIEFQTSKKDEEKGNKSKLLTNDITPEEILEEAYQELQNSLATDLLETIKKCPPDFFERLVIDVLIKIGYGGSRQEAGQAMGQAGDGGIDGIIKEDKLGLDIIYIQAKRWEGTVGRPEVQKFAGALQGRRARKGIFITTSSFSKEAIEYAESIENKIILINGIRLAELMIDHNIGVSSTATYEIKKIDHDYFFD